jgi:hypothetical protein
MAVAVNWRMAMRMSEAGWTPPGQQFDGAAG